MALQFLAPLWPFFGGPFEGKYRNASVLHDVAYDQRTRPWQQVDRMFYDAMRCSGVGVVEAKTFYFALYRHGHHWKFKKKTDETRTTVVNPGEVDAIQEWIRNNNPSLDQIETRAERDWTVARCAGNPKPVAGNPKSQSPLRLRSGPEPVERQIPGKFQ